MKVGCLITKVLVGDIRSELIPWVWLMSFGLFNISGLAVETTPKTAMNGVTNLP